MERGKYDLTIVVSDANDRKLSEYKGKVTTFFTEQGHFAKSLFDAEVHKLLEAVAAKSGQ